MLGMPAPHLSPRWLGFRVSAASPAGSPGLTQCSQPLPGCLSVMWETQVSALTDHVTDIPCVFPQKQHKAKGLDVEVCTGQMWGGVWTWHSGLQGSRS